MGQPVSEKHCISEHYRAMFTILHLPFVLRHVSGHALASENELDGFGKWSISGRAQQQVAGAVLLHEGCLLDAIESNAVRTSVRLFLCDGSQGHARAINAVKKEVKKEVAK